MSIPVVISDIETTPDASKALLYNDVDEALEICDIVGCVSGRGTWHELPNGKYAIKASNDEYVCRLVPKEVIEAIERDGEHTQLLD